MSTLLSTLAILVMVTSVIFFIVYRSLVYRLAFSGLLVGLMVSYFLLT